MVVPSAYMWYVSQFQPGSHPVVPDTRTSFMSTTTSRGMAYIRAADADFHARVKANDKNAAAFVKTVQSPQHPMTLRRQQSMRQSCHNKGQRCWAANRSTC
jgi:hypothetical protein